MRILGILNYWDESPQTCTNYVKTVSQIVDELIVLDGRYASYPSELTESPTGGLSALTLAGEEYSVPVHIIQESVVYPDQPTKRNRLIEYARTLQHTPNDWILVVDADEEVHTALTKPQWHTYLESALSQNKKAVQCTVKHTTNLRGKELTGHKPMLVPRLFHLDPTLKIEGSHYNYLFEYEGVSVNLYGDKPSIKWWQDGTKELHILNKPAQRTAQRNQERISYYQTRKQKKEESFYE